MKWFLYLISFSCIASGSCLILYTIQYRDLLKNVLTKSYEKIIAASAIIIGNYCSFSNYNRSSAHYFRISGARLLVYTISWNYCYLQGGFCYF
jgi:hypothetical protein